MYLYDLILLKTYLSRNDVDRHTDVIYVKCMYVNYLHITLRTTGFDGWLLWPSNTQE